MLFEELLTEERLVVVNPIGGENEVVFLLSEDGAFDYRRLKKFRCKIVLKEKLYFTFFDNTEITYNYCPPSIERICTNLLEHLFMDYRYTYPSKAFLKLSEKMVKETMFYRKTKSPKNE